MKVYIRKGYSWIAERLRRWSRYEILLGVLIVSSVVAQRLWIAQNQAPPELLDDADHLMTSLALYQTLIRHGLVEFIKQFIQSASHYYHPPLIPALTAPFYAVVGPSVRAALWVNTLFIGLLYGYLFKLVRQLAGERPALIAVAIMALFPMTYGLARLYLLEFGLGAVVVIWLYYFCRSDGLMEKRYVPWLGVLLGAGLLTKATFPMYIVGPVLWEIGYKAWKDSKAASQTVLIRMLLVSGIGGLLALPWYWNHIDWVWMGARYISGDLNQSAQLKHALSWSSLVSFWTAFIEEGPSVFFVILGLALLGILAASRRRLAGYPVGWFLAWWIPPFLICSVAAEKVSRYLFPALPALAALLSLIIYRILINARGVWANQGPALSIARTLALASLLIIPLGNFLQLSFFNVWTRLSGNLERRDFLGLLDHGDGHEFTYRPRGASWPVEAIFETLRSHTTTRPPKEIRGTIYFSSYPIAPANIIFAGMARNVPVAIYHLRCDPQPIARCLEDQRDREFLIVERPVMYWFELERALDNGQVPYHEVATLRLPSETEMVIYQRSPDAARKQPAPEE